MIEVILMERIERLGTLGQVVKVRPGYARNYLLPQKKAMRATKTNIAFFEKQRAVLEAQNAKLRAESEAEAKKLEGLHVMLIRQASDSGQLYGSVTARDVADAATEAGHKIERRCVEIVNPIKTIGLSELKIKLHPEVTVKITVNVARTEDEGRLQEQRGAAVTVKAEPAPEAASAEPAPEAAA
jgi:large subunit ribosomal protein L9